MKAVLIVGGMVAIAANALGPWMITLLFGDRYQAAGETFAVLSWAIGPYAAAFMAAQSLNSLDARGRGALTAVVMVGTHLLVMFGLLALEPAGSSAEGTIKAAAVGLLVGSIVGAATGLSVLGAQVNTPGHRWWITPMILIALPAGIMEIVSLPALLAVALSFALLLTLTWIAGVFSRDELDGIGERLGLRQLKPR